MKKLKRALVLLSISFVIFCDNNLCGGQNVPPKPDLIISSTRQMIDLNENSANYLGKLIKISGAWVSGDSIRRDTDEKIYCMDFKFGSSFDASEEYGNSFSPYPSYGKATELGFTVDLEDALNVKELLKSKKSSSLTSYVKCDLYFKIDRRKSISGRFKDLNDPVGHLVWINLQR